LAFCALSTLMPLPNPHPLRRALLKTLPDWVGDHAAPANSLFYTAHKLDYSFNGQLTFVVDVRTQDAPLATYKCNLHDALAEWVVFAPLVIHWHPQAVRQHGQGQQIIAHALHVMQAGVAALGVDSRVLVASGNLTIERAGLPFFTSLNWPVVTEATLPQAQPQEPLQLVAQQLQTLTASFRKPGDGGVSFAYYKDNA